MTEEQKEIVDEAQRIYFEKSISCKEAIKQAIEEYNLKRSSKAIFGIK